MSRSMRAWMESFATVSAAGGGVEKRASSTVRLVRFLAASMLVIALAPASALAGSTSGSQSNSQAPQKQQTSHIRRVNATVLALGSGYSSRADAARVRGLQRRLARAGDAPGPIDGRYGPRTEQAVSRFQAAHGLQIDGIAGPLTVAALNRPKVGLYPGTGYTGHGSGRVRALQRRLVRAGDAPGPIDGRYGPRTQQAVSRFQAAHGLQVNGIAGPQTLAHLGSQQPKAPQAAHRSHPAGGSRNRIPRGEHSRPPTSHQQPGPAPVPTKTAPVSHSTSSPSIGLLVLLIALAVALGLSATWLAYRHRNKRYAAADARSNGASRSEPAAVIAHPDHATTTTLNSTTTPHHEPTIPTPDPEGSDDAERAFRHALLLEEEGDQIRAMAAYQQAEELGHGAAAANLGVLLERHGDRASAEASYRRADQRGDAHGAFNLAGLLEERGNVTGALEAYRRADQRGHGAAASNLGVLLEQHGERAAAEVCYRRAAQRGDANGAFNLAVLLEEGGDHVGALRSYQRAEELGQPEIAEMAHVAAFELEGRVKSPSAVGNGGTHNGS